MYNVTCLVNFAMKHFWKHFSYLWKKKIFFFFTKNEYLHSNTIVAQQLENHQPQQTRPEMAWCHSPLHHQATKSTM